MDSGKKRCSCDSSALMTRPSLEHVSAVFKKKSLLSLECGAGRGGKVVLGCTIMSEKIIQKHPYAVRQYFIKAAITKDLALQLLHTGDNKYKMTHDPKLASISAGRKDEKLQLTTWISQRIQDLIGMCCKCVLLYTSVNTSELKL